MAPAGTTSVSFYVEHAGAGGAQAWAYYDCLYAARKVSAGMLEADILKALLVLGESFQSPNYAPGAAGVPPLGFRLAQAFLATFLDGSTGQVNLEIGEGASIAGHPALSYANLLRWRKVEKTATGAWSWTVPAGVRRVRATLVGAGQGGGGGQGGTTSVTGIGGDAGVPGGAIVVDLDVTPGQVLSGVIGTGGPGGAGSYNGAARVAGTIGGNTTLVVGTRTWTARGGNYLGLGAGGAVGGYGESADSGRVYDPLDGLLCKGDGATARFSAGSPGAANLSEGGLGSQPSYVAAGVNGGPGATSLNGGAGLAGDKGAGGGGGGAGRSGSATTGGPGGKGGDGYVLIEY